MPVINHNDAAELRSRIDARIDTGVRAARYDGDPGNGGGAAASHPERCIDTRPDPVSDRACEDLSALEQALATISRLTHDYPLALSKDAGQRAIPGKTVPAVDRCGPCWYGGRSRRKAPGSSWCEQCKRFRDTMRKRDVKDAEYPPLVIAAHISATARLASEGMKRTDAEDKAWLDHNVHRAWAASGWKIEEGERLPVGRVAA